MGAAVATAVSGCDDSGVRREPASAKAPVRMAFVYVPNGMDMRNWNPDYEGKLERTAAHPEAAGTVQERHHWCSAI